jgi:EamA domain-containing membrane protein RarD
MSRPCERLLSIIFYRSKAPSAQRSNCSERVVAFVLIWMALAIYSWSMFSSRGEGKSG